MNPREDYGSEITNRSFRELERIAEWLNIHGHHPIVIGGWAAYYYTRGLGSRDIDLILPKNALPVLQEYCKEHDYVLNKSPHTRFLFSKKIGKDAIELDVFTFDHKNKLAKNPRIEIPWSLAKKDSIEWKIDVGTVRVPSPELLLLYKAAALIDRKFKKQKWALKSLQKQHLDSKIWKDRQDIQSLKKRGIDEKKLERLLQKTKFKTEFDSIEF
ncbi:MAG: hypothetical protein V1847_05175 [Candidatus Diapherotrites archaeon]